MTYYTNELVKLEETIKEIIWDLRQQLRKSGEHFDMMNDLLQKAEANLEAHQDVVKAAARMVRHIDAENKTTRTTGGPYQLAADNLRLSLAFILNPNGDAS